VDQEDLMERPDLTPFREANEKKISWEERRALIHKQFPSTTKLDWYKVFEQDPSIMGKILNDILKIDLAEPGKPGKRPALDAKAAEQKLRQYDGSDYTILSFPEAFRILSGNRSIRHIASKTGLDRNMVYRLLRGEVEPTSDTIEIVAVAFNKHPSYFLEYRMGYIFGVLFNKLESIPESTITFYRKIKFLKSGAPY